MPHKTIQKESDDRSDGPPLQSSIGLIQKDEEGGSLGDNIL